MSTEFNFDGVLGMEFLAKYPAFIDYPNRMIYTDLKKSVIPPLKKQKDD